MVTISGLPAPVTVLLSILVLLAAFTDARTRRIPNWLTGAGILVALGIHFILNGRSGLVFGSVGMIAGFTLYFLLYLLRALGAGDVKLMAAVGAFAGVALWFQIFIATAIVGAVAALLLALAKRKLTDTLWNTSFIATELLHFRAPYAAKSSLDVKDPGSLTLPHAIAIALGVFLVISPSIYAGLIHGFIRK